MPGFSLGKAHKLYSTLTQELKKSAPGRTSARRRRYSWDDEEQKVPGLLDIDMDRARGLDDEALADSIQEKVAAIRTSVARGLALSQDAALLKEAIFAANQKSGVSARLAEQKLVADELDLQMRIHEEMVNAEPGVITEAMVPGAIGEVRKQAEEGTGAVLRVRIFDTDAVEARIRDLRVRRNELDEEVRRLNAETTIAFEFSAEAETLLGL